MVAVTNDDITFWISGGSDNGDPTQSLGGAISTAIPGQLPSGKLGNLWPFVTPAQQITGIAARYRCIYVQNNNDTDTIKQARLYFQSENKDSDITVTIGLDRAGLNGVAVTIANENTAPAGVTFTRPVSYDHGLSLGDITAGDFYPFWIKQTVIPHAKTYYADAYVLRVQGFRQNSITDWGFAVGGLFGCKSTTAETIIETLEDRLDDNQPIKLFLPLGGLSFASTADCWFKLTKNLDTIMNLVFGDPELGSTFGKQPDLRRQFFNHIGHKTSYYSFDTHNIHYLVMSTETDYKVGSPQYQFVGNDLKAASKRADIDWIVVAYYEPAYSAGGQPDIPPFTKASFRKVYFPLFDTYHVDLILNSHCRNYQRTYPIRYDAAKDGTPVIVDNTHPHNYTNVDGRIQVIVGTGGQTLDGGSLKGAPGWFVFTDNKDFGYLWLGMTKNGSVMSGTFYNIQRQPIDTFSITKTI